MFIIKYMSNMKTSVHQSDGVRVIVMVFNTTFNNISVI
jgi:hypothetical protein